MIKSGTDLSKRLLRPEFDRERVCEALFTFYSRSSGSSDDLTFGDQDNPSIRILWTKDGKIKKLVAARDLEESEAVDLQSLFQRTFEPCEPRFLRFPLTCRRPIQGAIGFDGWFQIVPAPSTAPQPPSGWGDCVGVLEVQTEGSQLPMIVSRQAYRQARTIELLLAALTTGGFRLLLENSRSSWVLDPNDQGRPRHMQHGYWSDGVAGSIDKFSDIEPMNSIELVETNEYYTGVGNGSSESAVLPDSFPNMMQRFNSLSSNNQNRVLRAAYWIKHSEDVWAQSRSAAFIAAVSSIECMLPPDVEVLPACQTCGEKKSMRPTQRFNEFVESVVGDAVPRKQRLQFYNRRSRMVHGDSIARNDDFDWGSVDPLRLSEEGEHRSLNAISKMAFHNWLLAQQ